MCVVRCSCVAADVRKVHSQRQVIDVATMVRASEHDVSCLCDPQSWLLVVAWRRADDVTDGLVCFGPSVVLHVTWQNSFITPSNVVRESLLDRPNGGNGKLCLLASYLEQDSSCDVAPMCVGWQNLFLVVSLFSVVITGSLRYIGKSALPCCSQLVCFTHASNLLLGRPWRIPRYVPRDKLEATQTRTALPTKLFTFCRLPDNRPNVRELSTAHIAPRKWSSSTRLPACRRMRSNSNQLNSTQMLSNDSNASYDSVSSARTVS